MEEKKTNGKYIASLVLGICSLVFGMLIIPIVGLIISIKSGKELKDNNETNGMVIAGLILNTIGLIKGAITTMFLVLGIIVMILTAAGTSSYSSYSTKKPSTNYRSSSYYSY